MNATLPKVTALAPWFGSNRTLAPQVGELLRGCSWCGVPFAGSMTELLYIDAPTLVASDLHQHIINLASVAADANLNRELRKLLKTTLFHPDTLAECQRMAEATKDIRRILPSVEMAYWFFVASWMGRSGNGGTDKEFTGKLPVRWTATGGDSCTRLRSAASSLREWYHVLRRANFVVQDCFEFLGNVKDHKGHAVYADPPFPDAGEAYSHKFTEKDQRRLAVKLADFQNCRVVCRFYDHALIRELYPTTLWAWHHYAGRKQSNATGPEVLLVRNGSVS